MSKYALIAALALGVGWTGGAQAASVTASGAALKSAAAETTNVASAAYRRCWRRNGSRRCSWVDGPSYRGSRSSDYYVQDASKLPFGSQRWWSVKEREGSAGRP
jgi:hypothetical protein